MVKVIFALVVCAFALHGQTTFTRPVVRGTEVPMSCTINGQFFVDTDGTEGQNVYLCDGSEFDLYTGTGGGSGTVNTGASGCLAYYPSAATTVDDIQSTACRVKWNGTDHTLEFYDSSGTLVASIDTDDGASERFGTATEDIFTDLGADPSAPASGKTAFYTYGGRPKFRTNGGSATDLADGDSTGAALRIPSGTNPTVDAAGKMAIDLTVDQVRLYGGAERVLSTIQSFSFVIPAPATSDDINLMKAPYGMTILGIDAIIQGSTSATGQLQECNSSGASCTDLDSDITADSDGAADDGSLTDSTIAKGAWLRWKTTSLSGTPDFLTVTVRYRIVAE